MKMIGVVSVARSDASIYLPVLRAIHSAKTLDLKLLVTGMHLSREFGETWRDFEAEGFMIDERVECTMSSDTPEGIAKTIGLGVIGFGQVFARWRPDILMVLGDRFEMLAAALAALPHAMPIAHLHGGETTEGAIDEAIRHALTKMSHIHLVATEAYARRVAQLGEEPWRIHVTGAPGLDNALHVEPWSRELLEEVVGMRLDRATVLATLHPVTLDYESTPRHIEEFLAALETLGMPVVFTYPNADTAGRQIIDAIRAFVAKHSWAKAVVNLGSAGYAAMLRHAAVMVGNSSSGIIEAASFELPVVNVGDRQRGRLRAENVIDVDYDRHAIVSAVRRALEPVFRDGLRGMKNPYGDGAAAARVVQALDAVAIDRRLIIKRFQDASGVTA